MVSDNKLWGSVHFLRKVTGAVENKHCMKCCAVAGDWAWSKIWLAIHAQLPLLSCSADISVLVGVSCILGIASVAAALSAVSEPVTSRG